MSEKSPRIGRFILIGVLLVLTPAFFSLFLGLHLINSFEKDFYADKQAQLEGRARTFVTNLDSELFFLPIFRNLSTAILTLQHSENDKFKTLIQSAFAEAGQTFSLMVFNHEGPTAFTNITDPETFNVFEYIWRFAHNKSDAEEFKRQKGVVGKVLGRDFHPRLVRDSNDICHPLANHGKQGLLYHYKQEQNGAGVLIHLEITRDPASIVKQLAKLSSSAENPILLGTGSQEISKEIDINEDIIKVLALSGEKQHQIFRGDGFLWQHQLAKEVPLFFGQRIDPPNYPLSRLIVCGFFILITFFSLSYLFRSMFSGGSQRISIRYKLVALFVFAVYLPVLGLFLLGYNGLANRRTVLENNVSKAVQDLLFKIDSEFSVKEEEILAIFTRLYENTSWQNQITDDWDAAELVIRKAAKVPLTGENFFNHLDMRNLQQQQVFSTNQGDSNDRTKEVNRIISLISLEKHLPDQLPKNNLTRQSDLILKNMMENPVLGFTSFYEQPGKLVQMEFEGSSFYWYWNFYPKNNEKIAYIYGNTRIAYNVVNYLQSIFNKRLNIGNTALKLVAHYPTTKLWLPEGADQEKDLLNLNKLAEVNAAVETARISFAGQRYMATCLPGLKLKKAFLTCLYPEAEIDDKINTLRQQIYMGVILILIISILTGLLLSKTFLQPVSELNLGLKALHQRNIDFRVQIENQDELGELGKTFNQMMEEVKEMFLAGAVQQCLIPATALEMPGYDSVIYNKMATDVGGDYADFFPLPDQRFLIVLGDVTGHGISSSILTAMVKALVFRFASKDTSLEVILKSLSEMIFELLKYRKLMTFCAMILDTKDNSFLLANAGHPFPIVCDANGQITSIEHSSLPLGVSVKRSNYTTTAGQFEPGSILMLYTDGIAEGANPEGVMFGFDTVEKVLKENRNSNSESIKSTLLNKFWQHYQREELDDDLTFIIIKRSISHPEITNA